MDLELIQEEEDKILEEKVNESYEPPEEGIIVLSILIY